MIRVLVLGADGQLGRTIKETDITKEGQLKFYFFNKETLDITDFEKLEEHFALNQYDFCINCAAYTNVEKAEDEPDLAKKINCNAVENLARLCAKNHCILVHISTDYVFDGRTDKPYSEKDDTNPINAYGKSKLEGELKIQKTLAAHYIIRSSWLYSKYEGNFFRFVYDKLEASHQITITEEQTGVPTSTTSLCKFILHLLKNHQTIPFGTYHYVDQGQATWYEFAQQIANSYFPEKKYLILPINQYKTKAERPMYSVLSHEKTKSVYPEIPIWKESLKEVL